MDDDDQVLRRSRPRWRLKRQKPKLQYKYTAVMRPLWAYQKERDARDRAERVAGVVRPTIAQVGAELVAALTAAAESLPGEDCQPDLAGSQLPSEAAESLH